MRIVLTVLAMTAAFACATTQTPLTQLGYSHWGSRTGANALGEFKRVRSECLEQHHLDPDTVAAGSSEEKRFATCMQVKGWCTLSSCN